MSQSSVYMLTNRKRKALYIGSTDNLKKRIYHHKRRLIAGFTKKYNLDQLVYFEHLDWNLASTAMWGVPNLELCLNAGIDKIAIQPRGKAQALVSERDLKELSNRRIAIEARISHLKRRGLGKSRMKSDIGDLISGYRSALSYNLSLLMRDLTLQPAWMIGS